MPAIQELTPNPSFGSQLGQQLGSGISEGIGASLNQMLQQKQSRSQLKGLTPLLQQAGLDERQINEVVSSGLDPKIVAQSAQNLIRTKGAEDIKSEQQKRITQDSFDRMAELLKGKNLGLGSKIIGYARPKVAEDVAEFESLNGALESALVERVNKGTLSNTRFKYITETLLPKPTDREAVIRGKLKALAKELDLDPSVLIGESKEGVSEESESEEIFGGGKIELTNPKTGESFYPKNKEQVNKAKSLGWKVTRGS